MKKVVDNETFNQMYRQYYHFVLMLSYSYFQSLSASEDAVQEVFLKYLEKNPQFPNHFAAKNWFYKVTTTCCHDFLRKSRREKRVLTKEDSLDPTGDWEVQNLVFDLPPKYRVVTVLYYYLGYKIEEIAKILKISDSAVKKRLERARERIGSKI